MDGLCALLPSSTIVTPETDPKAFESLTSFWAAQLSVGQKAVIVPPDAVSLAKVVKYLYDSDLDFGFRGHGFTSLLTKDVLVSLHKLDGFSYDPERHTIEVGAGQTWMRVYEQVEKVAPNYTVIGARTPAVGVGGTIITGGFSWLSARHGCISDPENMIDCEVVKHDGSIVWASSEPELLWALRGGGGGFGAITKAVFQLHPISRKIFHGNITVPKSAISQAFDEISNFSTAEVDAGVSVLMYVQKKKFHEMHSVKSEEDVLVFQVFDPYGEEHGHRAFSWALNLPGAQQSTSVGSMLDIIRLQNNVARMRGTSQQYWAPIIVKDFSKEQLEACRQWYADLENYGASIADNTYMIYELFCAAESSTPQELSWPGPRGCQHMLIIGVGCEVGAPAKDVSLARNLAKEAPSQLMGREAIPTPNAIEDWSDMSKIYGENYGRLVQLRLQYDPKRRLKGHIEVGISITAQH